MSAVKYANKKASKRGANKTIGDDQTDTFSKRSGGHEEKTQQCLHNFETVFTLFGAHPKGYQFIMCFRQDYGTYLGNGMGITISSILHSEMSLSLTPVSV